MRCDTFCLWHSADPGRMFHHALALGDGELAKQEKALARRGGNPIGIAAAGIQERGLRGAGGLLGQMDQLVFDLERDQSLEFAQGKFVAMTCSLLEVEGRSLCRRGELDLSWRDDIPRRSSAFCVYVNKMTRIIPQVVSNTLPTAYVTV